MPVADLLASLGAQDVTTVADQVRAAHSELPKERCMAWLHKRKFPRQEGGCDVHSDEQ